MAKWSWIVVVGTSAGGTQALKDLVAQLPSAFSAPMFIVQHMAPDADPSVLAKLLTKAGPLPCSVVKHRERFKPGRIYIAPADSHMLIKKATVLVTKGARENRYRPA